MPQKQTEKINKSFVMALTANDENCVPEWIQLLPKGWIKPNGLDVLVDDQSLNTILARFKSRENDIVLDYEHQTLAGGEAPAAGWITDLEARDNGLWAKVDWTERGRAYVAAREYRYISPVVLVNQKDCRGMRLQSVALTNNPAIDGMQPVAAKEETEETGGINMDFLAKLAELLGLSSEASEDEVLAAIQGMVRHEEEVPQELADVLELEEGEATVAAAKKKIYAMKAGRVPAGELAKVSRQLAEMRAERMIEVAMSEGKITPAQKNWAIRQAAQDPKGFEEFLRTAPKVVPMTEMLNGPVSRGSRVTDAQREINKKLRVSDSDFKKYGGHGND